jgi:hypothetical protein
MLSGICWAAITSMEMAKANAASMNVSSRVISIPRSRNPLSRGSASRFAGIADVISSFLLLVLNGGGESAENLAQSEAASSSNPRPRWRSSNPRPAIGLFPSQPQPMKRLILLLILFSTIGAHADLETWLAFAPTATPDTQILDFMKAFCRGNANQ